MVFCHPRRITSIPTLSVTSITYRIMPAIKRRKSPCLTPLALGGLTPSWYLRITYRYATALTALGTLQNCRESLQLIVHQQDCLVGGDRRSHHTWPAVGKFEISPDWQSLRQISTVSGSGKTNAIAGGSVSEELDQRAGVSPPSSQCRRGAEDRALLLYASTLECMAVFAGCPHMGVIAVSVYAPTSINLCRASKPLWQGLVFFCRYKVEFDQTYTQPQALNKPWGFHRIPACFTRVCLICLHALGPVSVLTG